MAKQNLGRKTGGTKKNVNPQVEMLKHFVQSENNRDIPSMHRCCRCGLTTTTDLTKFPLSYSQLYASNDYRLPICKDCLDDLYNNVYYPMFQNDEMAVRRICSKFDIYYNPKIVQLMRDGSRPKKHMSFYAQKTTLQQYSNRTFDTTLEEETVAAANIDTFDDMNNATEVSEKTIKFWGFGFSPEDYEYLDNRYVEWSTSYNIQSKAMESIFQKICMMELQILKGIQKNEKVDALYRQLNDFMNAAGIQPKQSSENTMSDTASFGTLIKRWEDEEPIPEPKPEWRDVDGIRRYISVYFLGHLSKMFGFKNDWSRLYEEEIAKYTVNKPDFDDSNEISYEDIFGSGDDNG